MSVVLENPYVVLGVPEGASQAVIKDAYRAAAKRFHPDSSDTPDAARFDAVTQAFDLLRDSVSRRRVDAELAARRAEERSERMNGATSDAGRAYSRPENGSTSGAGRSGQRETVDDDAYRFDAPWVKFTGKSGGGWVFRAGQPSVGKSTPPSPRVARETFPLFGAVQRRNVVPAMLAGLLVAVWYSALALLRFDPGMARAVRDAAGDVGVVHVLVAAVVATLVALSALGARPKQRVAVIVSTVCVVGGAAAVTVVQKAWMWALIFLAAFLYKAAGSRPRV
jgi:hypothetical protein